VTFVWIKGHDVDGDPNNHPVDRLAERRHSRPADSALGVEVTLAGCVARVAQRLDELVDQILDREPTPRSRTALELVSTAYRASSAFGLRARVPTETRHRGGRREE
jgi:hypothetical protein